MSKHPSSILLLLLCFLFCSPWRGVVANTEIINFSASARNDAAGAPPETVEWPVLHRAANKGNWSIHPASLGTAVQSVCEPGPSALQSNNLPCVHELWVVLDLEHEKWTSYAKFTLRLSWPASSPADFLLEIYSPEDLVHWLSKPHHNISGAPSDASVRTTRRKYARIRLVDTGVRTPPVSHLSRDDGVVDPVHFILILEPLYLGVLPASVLPVLLFLAPALGLAALAVPRINHYLERIVKEARLEIEVNQSRSAKK